MGQAAASLVADSARLGGPRNLKEWTAGGLRSNRRHPGSCLTALPHEVDSEESRQEFGGSLESLAAER